jgi:hypothetical protein
MRFLKPLLCATRLDQRRNKKLNVLSIASETEDYQEHWLQHIGIHGIKTNGIPNRHGSAQNTGTKRSWTLEEKDGEAVYT